MQRLKDIIIAVLLIALFWVWNTNAGTPTGPNTPPDSTYWYTIDAIYERLNAGTTGSQSAFTEPTSAPGTQTTITLNDVMDKAPAANNTNGAEPGEVLSDKTYWSLRTDGSGSSKWGVITGTLPTQTLIDSSMDIKAGYYTTTTLKSVDSDFVNTNIKSGVNIFGVAGNVIEATGNATAADVLTGKTFSKDGSANLTGTMVNQGSKSYTPTASVQTITAGYYNGTGKVNTDSDLVASNIKNDVDIFGVAGNVIEATGNATAADVLTGKTFSKDGSAGVSGTMPTQTLIDSSINVNAGYYTTTTLESVDPDLVAKKIGKGFEIFGVTGTFTTTPNLALVPKTGITTTYSTGDDGDLEKGVEWPNPRFTDNGDGTVTDNLTGLIWLKDANCASGTINWATALSHVRQLNTKGTMNSNDCGDKSNGESHQTDWRLPNIKELLSLIDYSQVGPPLPSDHPFTGVQSYYYWSSTTNSFNTANAWYVNLYYGGVVAFDKTGDYYVWPVRGGQ